MELSQVIVGELENSASPQIISFLARPETRAIVPLEEMLALARCVRNALGGNKITGMVSTLTDDVPSQSDSEGDLSPVVV